tara:strand:- start:93 stop:506 length:414 start_codon:yes stop_codon:yes gene_type:complete
MKTYNNGPRKGMMYGGMTRRKPMMYGGTANQMSAKKAKGQQMPREERKSKNVEPAMGMPKMAGGGRLKEPDNPGLKKLPKKVRNRMGFMSEGGVVPDELKTALEVIMKNRKTKRLTKQEQKEVDAMIDEMLGRKEIN